ncbi:hypothetical protein WG899_10100 [Paucibacter sp. AS339]|uniref:hypothetical protein n=1 Tax=Paucibacter hankyongi TaxID=3133434 RepID=UPI003096DB84
MAHDARSHAVHFFELIFALMSPAHKEPIAIQGDRVSSFAGSIAQETAGHSFQVSAQESPTDDVDRQAPGVVQEIKQHCDEHGIPHPSIFSESGRALGQTFPLMPIRKLATQPTRLGSVQDVTCDSDGKFERYVGVGGLCGSLPMHDIEAGEDYVLAGAYQETMGSVHKLMGVNASANVYLNEDGSAVFKDIMDMPPFAGYRPDQMMALMEAKLARAGDGSSRLQEDLTIYENSYLRSQARSEVGADIAGAEGSK